MIANKTWYLTADRSKAVPEGDKSAQSLLVREGQEISDADAKKYGIDGNSDDSDSDKKSDGKKPDSKK